MLRLSTRNASAKSSANRAFGKIVNQSLLDDLLCLSRVVVPMARCFSSDSYAGSVIRRSIDSAGWARSQSTASRFETSKRGVLTRGLVILRQQIWHAGMTGEVNRYQPWRTAIHSATTMAMAMTMVIVTVSTT